MANGEWELDRMGMTTGNVESAKGEKKKAKRKTATTPTSAQMMMSASRTRAARDSVRGCGKRKKKSER